LAMVEAGVILAVRDPALAASLELALLAGGLTPHLYDPAAGFQDLAALPLDAAGALILGPHTLNGNAPAFIEALRARPWDGLVILITGDGEKLRGALGPDPSVAVLEMPFGGADLIAVIRSAWPG